MFAPFASQFSTSGGMSRRPAQSARALRRLRRLSFLGLALATAGCNEPLLTSSPLRSPIAVDGSLVDWEGLLLPVESVSLSVGVAHEDSTLYLALATVDPVLQGKILRQGFHLWFDEKGGSEREKGVRLRFAPQGLPGSTRHEKKERKEAGSQVEALAGAERIEPRVETIEDGYWRPVIPGTISGIYTALSLDAGALSVELRLPLAPQGKTRWSVATLPGTNLGLGLETPEPAPRQATPQDHPERLGRGGKGVGGRPGGAGRSGKGPRGAPAGGTRASGMMEPFVFWTKVQGLGSVAGG